ncbi:type I-C CRISPR-associated protein Cas7/Csd2 [Taylorella equigenitalis]|uniref:CRISPR protein, Cas7 n=1 Tax=Taylorella equigenitalis ATCC 35865 TaxID=743973 RepID=A0ABM5N8Q7_9BURK|nr:type I-C CRISPR-associated protein Cas7/Csd2 [Taylorella equigenitalis]AFN35328.1 CRISPR protein, Cas7 [Taylorella equigenitalis ATCC 35865]ASY37295.1 type I-C CRISPR-associated protein Cas7/Csd2 [Taylorella equigenitalis]ASY38761.1 type I-C CRISPR-associated protein Cas7/Csd2 [Taylorella equigenitalis]ASY40284.1 type I-C CRISPR-associated protein Cas7/Csd2 [Taylorella equigenitalis]ASY41717.1 type I-C CRISPR-associated protein Cas7/Csd2 [Taylorella equigenitalis]
MTLENKIDFALIIKVKNANPNGDPLNGNRPRVNFDGLGEISDVCLKRKIRNRILALKGNEEGFKIFVQSDDNNVDGITTLEKRAEDEEHGLGKRGFNDRNTAYENACKKWYDVRAFGQVFAIKKKAGESEGVSIGIRGPVTIQPAFSVDPVNITSTQITKSVSGSGDGKKKSSDTMGMKHRIDEAVYVSFGSISPQLAEKTGFSNDDADILKNAMLSMFEGDASSARPEGSMEILKLIWWKHDSKLGKHSSAKVHQSLEVNSDGSFNINDLSELKPEILDGR